MFRLARFSKAYVFFISIRFSLLFYFRHTVLSPQKISAGNDTTTSTATVHSNNPTQRVLSKKTTKPETVPSAPSPPLPRPSGSVRRPVPEADVRADKIRVLKGIGH